MFSDKILLITGVSGGIGYVIMEYFVEKVKNLITSSRKQFSEFNKFAAIPKNLDHLSLDLTVKDNVIKLFNHIKEKYGRIDIIINCVGGSLYTHPIEEFPIEEFDEIIKVNLRSAFLITKYGINLMKENSKGGNIIHLVSSSAINISKNKAPYGIAKAGLSHLIHYSAHEAGKYNIKINGVNPTYVLTPRHISDIDKKAQKMGINKEKIIEGKLSRQILKRPMYPEDLIGVIELLSKTNSITGQIYNCTMGEVLM